MSLPYRRREPPWSSPSAGRAPAAKALAGFQRRGAFGCRRQPVAPKALNSKIENFAGSDRGGVGHEANSPARGEAGASPFPFLSPAIHLLPDKLMREGSSTIHKLPDKSGCEGSSTIHKLPDKLGCEGSSTIHKLPDKLGCGGSSTIHGLPDKLECGGSSTIH